MREARGRFGRVMASPLVNRSQAILRMPVDMVNATIVMHDGERNEVMLFVPSGEGIVRMLAERTPFVPVVLKGRVCLLARDIIAAIAVDRAPLDAELALPAEEQRVKVKLRAGTLLEGTLSWCPAGQQRTKDYLNSDDSYFELHVEQLTYFVVKAQVATVQDC
jgi:hypothetical protein